MILWGGKARNKTSEFLVSLNNIGNWGLSAGIGKLCIFGGKQIYLFYIWQRPLCGRNQPTVKYHGVGGVGTCVITIEMGLPLGLLPTGEIPFLQIYFPEVNVVFIWYLVYRLQKCLPYWKYFGLDRYSVYGCQRGVYLSLRDTRFTKPDKWIGPSGLRSMEVSVLGLAWRFRRSSPLFAYNFNTTLAAVKVALLSRVLGRYDCRIVVQIVPHFSDRLQPE